MRSFWRSLSPEPVQRSGSISYRSTPTGEIVAAVPKDEVHRYHHQVLARIWSVTQYIADDIVVLSRC